MEQTANEIYYKKMTETPVSRLIIKLGIPTTISMLITGIYNMADTYFVGTLGTSASAAVGVVFGLMAILQAIGFMFGHGTGSIIARKLGGGVVQEATEYTSSCFFFSLGSGILIGILGIIFMNPLMRLLGSTDTILPYASEYSLFILIAAPVMTVSCSLNNILRYEGKALLGMIGLVTGGLLNIFGDYLLIRVFNMGIAGAGISTAVSQTISFCILLSPFLTGRTQTKIEIKYVDLKEKKIFQIMETGLPSLFRQGLNSVSTMVLNGQAAVYGDAAVAGMSIVSRICFFIFAVGLGMGQGFQPVCSFNYGAKKFSRVKKGFIFTFVFSEILLTVFAIIGLIFSDNLIEIFRHDTKVIEIGTIALKYQLLGVILQPLSVCSNMMFQSSGHNAEASFTAILRSGLMFIPVILILPRFIGITGVQSAQPIADAGTFVISLWFLKRYFKNLPKE